MEYELPLILSRCPEIEGDEIGLDRGIVVIPKSHESWLNDKQLINYKEHRVRFLSWLWNVGKDVERATGYSEYTVYGSAYRTARFDKWRWEHCGGYSMPPSEEEAQAFVEWLAFDYDQSETAKENEVLRIPKEESSKNRENWIVSITGRTASALERWLKERDRYGRYEGTDKLWLTTHGNPYGSKSLSRLLKRLCEDANIRTDNRQLSWYAIRHSVGTYMTHERDLAATKAQLRHKSVKTTMKYDQVPVEERQDALDRMG